jgi:hypothetical protein
VIGVNYKQHLGYGLLGLIILTIILLLLTIYTGYVDFLHIFGGSIIVIYGFSIPVLIIAVIMGLYAVILPDVDIATSKAFVITFILLLLAILYFAVFNGNIMAVFVCVVIMITILGLKHRGIMHTILAGIIIGCIVGWLFLSFLVAGYMAVGYWIHLLCDR